MKSIELIFPDRGPLAALPLAVAFAAVPLGNALAAYSGGGVSIHIPWVLLAIIGSLATLFRTGKERASFRRILFSAGLLILLSFAFFVYLKDIVPLFQAAFLYLQELSPLVYLLFCGLWCVTFGMPCRSDFQRFGALLAVFCLIDLAVEVVLFHAVPTVRLLGSSDFLAGLLLVALCASLKPGENDAGLEEPDQGRPWWRLLIMLGLLSCLSRTGLFAAGWIVLCFGRGRIGIRMLFALGALACIVGTFFLPITATDAIRYVDYWLWIESLRLYVSHPMLIITGFPVDAALPLAMPASMAPIWEAATGSSSISGINLVQVPSFWLRVSLAWGIGVPLLLLGTIFLSLLNRLTRMGAGLVAAFFAQGMATPLLFDPAMATTIGIGFLVALSTPRHMTMRVAPEPLEETHEAVKPDDEWEMRIS